MYIYPPVNAPGTNFVDITVDYQLHKTASIKQKVYRFGTRFNIRVVVKSYPLIEPFVRYLP